MRLSNSEKMYNADASAIHVAGIPSHILMWTAAGHLARAAMDLVGANRTAAVFCGPGNNGGDGVAAAAILKSRGFSVRCFLVGRREKMSADALRMEQRLQQEGGELESFDPGDETLPGVLASAGVIIDAIFGIGLKRNVTGDPLQAVRLINAAGRPVVSADIPSGVSADTGAVLGEAVRAARTVTFSLAKPGHFLEPGCVYCGEVEVFSIGIPAEMVAAAESGVTAVTAEDVSLPRRDPLTHKGDHGKILIAGGSVGYTGAPNLAARAAVRAGAGLVYLGGPEAVWSVCAVKNDEAMPFPLPCDGEGRLTADALPILRERWSGCGVLALGPGMGRSDGTRALTRAVVREYPGLLVLDADALWAVSEEPEILTKAAGRVIVTPHQGEFRRMGGELTGERLCDAGVFARKYGCVTLLKGHRSVIAFPEGEAYIIAAGNPGMAKGGSGDVLTGVTAALLGQRPAEEAVVTAAWIHAAAGDACAAEKGEYGMTPTDIIEKLPYIMKGITK